MSASNPPSAPVSAEDAWPEMSQEEEAELRRDFAEGDEEYRRGECIPADEVVPRLRHAG
jgi:hypothetical protein